MYQVACFGRGSTWIEDLERLLVDWERENFLPLQVDSTS